MPAPAALEAERITDLTVLTDRLSEIIEGEIVFLKERRPRELARTEEEKTRLTKIYAGEIARFRKDPNLTKSVPRDVMTALKTATTRFRALVQRQEALLYGMQTVSERMIREIATELNKIKSPQRLYGRNAGIAGVRPVPFALNQTA